MVKKKETNVDDVNFCKTTRHMKYQTKPVSATYGVSPPRNITLNIRKMELQKDEQRKKIASSWIFPNGNMNKFWNKTGIL